MGEVAVEVEYPPPAPRPWEGFLIDRYRRVGKMAPWKGLWIREHLAEMVYDYPYSMFSRWRLFCESAKAQGVKIKAGSYQSFRTYLHLLHKLGLVERELKPIGHLTCPYCEREIPVYPQMIKRKKGGRISPVHYHLVYGRRDDPAWLRPYQVLFPSTDWRRKTPEEKRVLRRKYRKKSKGDLDEV